MSGKLRFALCGVVLCTLASCVESDRPLSDALKSEQDSRLDGLWSLTNKQGDVEYLHIGAEASEPVDRNRVEPEPGMMRYCTITHSHQARGLGKAGEGHFFRTKIDGEDFANWVIPADEAKHKPMTYCFLKYSVDEKQLVMWDQDAEATAKAIEAGKLKGVVQRKKNQGKSATAEFDELRITDSTENIAAFFAAGGAKSCFPDKASAKIVYTRVR
jgi:hypothetical protein